MDSARMTLAALREHIGEQLTMDAAISADMRLRYLDDEGSEVDLLSDVDLQEALLLMAVDALPAGRPVLRICGNTERNSDWFVVFICDNSCTNVPRHPYSSLYRVRACMDLSWLYDDIHLHYNTFALHNVP